MFYSASLLIDSSLHLLNVLNIYEYEGYSYDIGEVVLENNIQTLYSLIGCETTLRRCIFVYMNN